MSRRPPAARTRGARPGDADRGRAMFRLRFGFIIIAMVLSVFGARLVQLQGLDPNAYAAMAAAEGIVKVELPATRGAIVDRNGVELASSIDGMMIVGDPQMTRAHAAEIATRLADEVGVDYFTVLDRLRRQDTRFQYLARRVPATLATRVVRELTAEGYKGLSTRRDPMRDYPADDVAASLIGFIGEDEALAGFERTFDEQLSGVDGSTTYQVGAGNRIPLGENTTVNPVNGQDLVLTIDRDLQFYAQRVLAERVREVKGESGTVIVMDTRSGEILAAADYPTFDANDPLGSPKEDLGVRSASETYEPGSVQKVLTFASLIDAGKITPRTRLEVPESLRRNGHTVRDHWSHGDIRLTAAGALAKSSNIGTILAAEELGHEELYDYLSKFGLGQHTDLGIRGETRGVLPAPETWSAIRHATIAFGQGLSVNAFQMTAAINAIANDGVLVSPSLIQGKAVTDSGNEVGTDTTTRTRVVSEDAARQTAEMMELVTDAEDGIAKVTNIPGYRVAGKTGTAQRVGKDCGCYDGTFTVSFGGFAPADDARFTVYVMIQNPAKGYGGGSAAGPVFKKVMTHLLSKYAVPPTGTPDPALPVEW
ncbi:penicillin-binding protein 2 [Nocardioides sp. AE5]|uniref:peptidoglycan D,D-transpeptidase FtsI family protein n=1 Tax=Nocardioides sp. AE5 TaxID=2962573 RepID=UPI002881EEB5|nr:penicillin-binding protein 2 [Nocardioides sp. AE5]MDT0201251.1 penicillin-binding protein 2 [Nocardioides sp. AE5]